MNNSNVLKICGVLVLMIALMFTGCTMEDIVSENEIPADESFIDIGGGGFVSWILPRDIGFLIRRAAIIVTGEIISDGAVERINIALAGERPLYFIYTISELKVHEVIKGGVSQGDIIRIRQMGGTYEGRVFIYYPQHEYFREGQYGIFFLYVWPGWYGPATLINPYQGFIEIVDGEIRNSEPIFEQLFSDRVYGMATEIFIERLILEELIMR